MAKKDPRVLKSKAAAALDKGKHKKALDAYMALEEVEPGDGQWPRRVGDMHRRLGQPKLAIAALERAADKYMRAGFLVKAIAVCKMILQLDPEHSAVQQRLAALNAQQQGRAEPAGPAAQPPAPAQPAPRPAAPAQAAPRPAAPKQAAPRPAAPKQAAPRPAPPPPPVPKAPASTAAVPAGKPPRRHKRARTIPPDAPLDAVSLGEVVPDAVPELREDGQDSGITEIPIELQPAGAGAAGPGLGAQGERALRQTPLLSSLGPDAMRRLISEVTLIELAPGQVVFREGEPGRTLYVIAEGSVSVISEGPPRMHLSQLHEGDFFGEIALVTNHARSTTIEADKEHGARLLELDRNVIGDLVDEEPQVLKALLRFLRERLVHRLIHTSPLFAPYAGDESRSLTSRFRFLEFRPGALLLEQDRKAAGLCVVLAGQLEAIRRDGDQERRLGTLGPGGICGEMSLLANQPSVFTVRATSKGFVLQLPGDVFREVIMTHPQVLMFISDLAEERRRRYQAIVSGDADYDAGRISLV